MSDAILQKTTVYAVKEDVEGTYKAPLSGASAISMLRDGADELVVPSKEALERNNLTASLDKQASRSGIKSVTGSMPLEFKAGDSGEPEYSILLESALGEKSAAGTGVASLADQAASHTLTFLALASHAASEFVVFQDTEGNEYGVMLDTTGADVEPVVDEWTDIDVANKVVADISAQTTDIEVATVVENALGTIADIALVFTITRADEVITLEQVENGGVIAPVSYLTDAEEGNVVIVEGQEGFIATTAIANLLATTGFAEGDIVVVLEDDAVVHVSPIKTIVTDSYVELLIPYTTPLEDVTLQKMLDYRTADEAHPSFSVTKYVTGDDANHIEEKALGCKVTSLAIENFNTGQQPTLNISYEGLNYDIDLANPAFTPTYDTTLPIVALCAKFYQGTNLLPVDQLSISLENTMGFKTSITSCNGKINSRVTGRNVSGTMLPYKSDTSISQFTTWDSDTLFSLFGWAYTPDSTGAISEIVAFYMPNCQLTEMAQQNAEGLLQESLSFAARKDDTLETLKIAFY